MYFLIISTLCREWRQEIVAFEKRRQEYFANQDEDTAQKLKDKGNKHFKLGLFAEAARLYTEALSYVPHALEASKAAKDGCRW